MPIHGNQINLNLINPYSAAAEQAVAAQRAAALRRDLKKNAAALQAASTPEEASLLDRWMASGHGQPPGDEDAESPEPDL